MIASHSPIWDEPLVLISLGKWRDEPDFDPLIEVRELSRDEAAELALLEMAVADGLRQEADQGQRRSARHTFGEPLVDGWFI